MSAHQASAALDGGTSAPGRSTTPLSTANHVGLGLAALLAVVDVAAVASIPGAGSSTEPGPPVEVLVFSAVMGVVTLVALALAWAGRWRRPAVRLAAVVRVLAALTALPGFFVEGVPALFVVWAAATVLATVVAVWLMLLRPRHR